MTVHPAIRISVDAESELRRQLTNYWILKAAWWTSPVVTIVATWFTWPHCAPVGLLGGIAYCFFCNWMLNQHLTDWLPNAAAAAENAAPIARKAEREIAIASQLATGQLEELLSNAWGSEEDFNALRAKLEELHKHREAELAWEAKRETAFDMVRQIVESSDDVLKERMLRSM